MTDLARCPECGNLTSNPDHSCVVYDGPPCKVEGCGQPTVWVVIAAPGTGCGWSCKAGHFDGHSRILTEEDVR